MAVTIVPATPGYFILDAYAVAGIDLRYTIEPVIAWEIGHFGSSSPVGVWSGVIDDDDLTMLFPSGRVEQKDRGGFWDSLDSWARDPKIKRRVKEANYDDLR